MIPARITSQTLGTNPPLGLYYYVTNSQKEFARKILAQQRLGWEYLEAERSARLAGMMTKDVLPSLQTSFAYSLTLEPRLHSGFVEFYAALSRGKKQC